MSQKTTGLRADQIAYLSSKLWKRHLRRFKDAAKGNVHMPGVFVIEQLNGIFGHGGWDVEELRREERLRQEFDNPNKPGTKQYRVVMATTVRLRIRDVDGNVVCTRDATATWPGTGPQLSDAYNVADGGAWTAALKRAAMTLGPQFGLGTVRDAKDEGAGGAAIMPDWRRAVREDRLPYPTSPHGGGVDPVTGWTADDEGDELDDDGPVDTSGARRYELDQRQDTRGGAERTNASTNDRATVANGNGSSNNREQPGPADDKRDAAPRQESQRNEPPRHEPQRQESPRQESTRQETPTPPPTGRSRDDVSRDCAAAIRTLTAMPGGRDAWIALFNRAIAATGNAGMTPPMWNKPQTSGGFSTDELERLLSGVRAETAKLGGGAT